MRFCLLNEKSVNKFTFTISFHILMIISQEACIQVSACDYKVPIDVFDLLNRNYLYIVLRVHMMRDVTNLIFFFSFACMIVIYYPPRDVFALNTGKYRPGCIFFCIHRRPGTMDNECE